jgi:hypothetical protein
MNAAGVPLAPIAVAFVNPTLSPMVPVFMLFAADAFPAAIANINVAPANEILFILISPVIAISIGSDTKLPALPSWRKLNTTFISIADSYSKRNARRRKDYDQRQDYENTLPADRSEN